MDDESGESMEPMPDSVLKNPFYDCAILELVVNHNTQMYTFQIAASFLTFIFHKVVLQPMHLPSSRRVSCLLRALPTYWA